MKINKITADFSDIKNANSSFLITIDSVEYLFIGSIIICNNEYEIESSSEERWYTKKGQIRKGIANDTTLEKTLNTFTENRTNLIKEITKINCDDYLIKLDSKMLFLYRDRKSDLSMNYPFKEDNFASACHIFTNIYGKKINSCDISLDFRGILFIENTEYIINSFFKIYIKNELSLSSYELRNQKKIWKNIDLFNKLLVGEYILDILEYNSIIIKIVLSNEKEIFLYRDIRYCNDNMLTINNIV